MPTTITFPDQTDDNENRDQLVDDSIEHATSELNAQLVALGLPLVDKNIALNGEGFVVELSTSPYDEPDVWQQYANALGVDPAEYRSSEVIGLDANEVEDLRRAVNRELSRMMDNIFEW